MPSILPTLHAACRLISSSLIESWIPGSDRSGHCLLRGSLLSWGGLLAGRPGAAIGR